MSYSIIRVEKIKSKTNTTGIQKHVQRENKNYNNPDIDFEKTHLNFDLLNEKNINFSEVIEKKIEQNYNQKRKIRLDAVKHIDGIITSDDKFFEQKSDSEIKDFFKNSLEFLEKEYGRENLLYATVHLDEKVPHMHFGFVPLTKDGRLSAKEMLGNKKAMTEFQDRFNDFVNERGFRMNRGTSKLISGKEREEINTFKQITSYHKQDMVSKGQELQDMNIELERVKEDYQNAVETLREPVRINYEEEYKKTGLFGSERVKTGNYIVSAEDFNRLTEQAKSSQQVLNRFEYMNKYDIFDKFEEERDKNIDLEKKNAVLNKKLSEVSRDAAILATMIRKIFEAIEKLLGVDITKVGIDKGFDREEKRYFDKINEIRRPEQKNDLNRDKGIQR